MRGAHFERESALRRQRWNAEYVAGRYVGEAAVPFVDVIASVVTARNLASGRGLYVGCGNGRNFIPLQERGFEIEGLDASSSAIDQLRSRCEGGTFWTGDFLDFAPPYLYDFLIAIQVFQHGDHSTAQRYIERARVCLRVGGLMFLRVNSSATEIVRAHKLIERSSGAGLTIRYLEGPKKGLLVHFYGREELEELTVGRFEPVMPLQEETIKRAAPMRGSWSQWEGVYRAV